MRTLQAVSLASILAIACRPMPRSDTDSNASSGVTIDLDRTRYAPGSQIQLRLTNHTNDMLGFNPCTRSIERRQGDAWSLIIESDRVCTMQLYLLNPHATRTDVTDLPARFEPGTYRLVLAFTRESPGVTPQTPASTIQVVSPPFVVE
jgi:hypothetical protein